MRLMQRAGWRGCIAFGVLAVALTSCGSSGASGSGATTTTTSTKASNAAFDACLKSHGVTLPSFGSGTGGGAPGGGSFGGGTGGGGFGGGGGFASNPKFSAALAACASLRPKGGGYGFGGGANSAALKAYTNCLKIYGETLPTRGFGGATGSTSTTTTTPASAAKLKNALNKCQALQPKGFGRGGARGASTTTTTTS